MACPHADAANADSQTTTTSTATRHRPPRNKAACGNGDDGTGPPVAARAPATQTPSPPHAAAANADSQVNTSPAVTQNRPPRNKAACGSGDDSAASRCIRKRQRHSGGHNDGSDLRRPATQPADTRGQRGPLRTESSRKRRQS